MRIQNQSSVKQVLKLETAGKRKRGRPKETLKRKETREAKKAGNYTFDQICYPKIEKNSEIQSGPYVMSDDTGRV